MVLDLLLLFAATAPETLRNSFEEGGARSDAHSSSELTMRALLPHRWSITGAELTVGALLAQDQDRPPPPTHPELSPRIRAGYDTVQLRKIYEDCVRRAAREEPARPPSATLSSLLTSLCGKDAKALRAAVLRRERASPDATRLADEAVAEATDAALETNRTRNRQ